MFRSKRETYTDHLICHEIALGFPDLETLNNLLTKRSSLLESLARRNNSNRCGFGSIQILYRFLEFTVENVLGRAEVYHAGFRHSYAHYQVVDGRSHSDNNHVE